MQINKNKHLKRFTLVFDKANLFWTVHIETSLQFGPIPVSVISTNNNTDYSGSC